MCKVSCWARGGQPLLPSRPFPTQGPDSLPVREWCEQHRADVRLGLALAGPPVYFQIVSHTCTSWLWHLPLYKPGLFLSPRKKGSFCPVGQYLAEMPSCCTTAAPDLQTELALPLPVGVFAWKTPPEPCSVYAFPS